MKTTEGRENPEWGIKTRIIVIVFSSSHAAKLQSFPLDSRVFLAGAATGERVKPLGL